MPTHTALRNAAIVCLSHTASSITVHSRAMVTIVTTGNHMLEVEPIGQHGSRSGQNGCGFSFCCYRMTPCYSRSTVSTHTHTHTHTHIQPFNGPLSGTTRMSRYQKGKTDLDFTGARDSEWQWHQLGRMQVCTSLQTDNHASTPSFSFYRPDALPAA